MRVLLSTCGSRGDLEPMERLAEGGALRTDGASVAATLLLDRS